MSPPATFAALAPAPRPRSAAPGRWAAGTLPPAAREPTLPSVFGVVARIRAQTAERMRAPDPDDVEVIVVDLDDDEILLSEADLTAIE